MNAINFPECGYTLLKHKECSKEILEKCAHLFSNHYAVWQGGKKKVKMTYEKLRNEYMFDEQCSLVTAQVNGEIIGQCFSIRNYQVSMIWITQLVVHEEYRQHGIAKELLRLTVKDDWNIVCMATSNPYSIQALESTLKVKFTPQPDLAQYVMKICPVPYLCGKSLHVSETSSTVNTAFFICHDEVNQIISKKINEQEWTLGNELPNGHEFFIVYQNSI